MEIDFYVVAAVVNEVLLRGLSDSEAFSLARPLLRFLRLEEGSKAIVIPAVYYLGDILARDLIDEIPVNAVAIARLMEEEGRSSPVYIFNPYSVSGLLPVPEDVNGGGGLIWAVVPIVVFGEDPKLGYDEEELDVAAEELQEVLTKLYGFEYVDVLLPPLRIEELLEELAGQEDGYPGLAS